MSPSKARRRSPAAAPQRGFLDLSYRRRWYRSEYRLTQRELATLAGLAPDLVADYETRRTLPKSIRAFVALAVALGVQPQCLIEPRVYEEIRRNVEERRAAVEARARARTAATRRRRSRS